MDLQMILAGIEKTRDKMYKLVKIAGLNDPRLIKESQELDRLINMYYKNMKK